MVTHPKLIFVLADGSRARLVRRTPGRAPASGDFVTLREIDGGERLREAQAWARSHPAGRSNESSSPRRSAVGPEDPYRQVKADFMAQVADAAKQLVAEGAHEGVVLAAPRRLLPILRRELGAGARVVNQLAKDLTKVPDHELSAWLSPLELAPQQA